MREKIEKQANLIQQAKAEVAREINMLLCILIRNVALEDTEAATLLIEQLTSIMEFLQSKYTEVSEVKMREKLWQRLLY